MHFENYNFNNFVYKCKIEYGGKKKRKKQRKFSKILRRSEKGKQISIFSRPKGVEKDLYQFCWKSAYAV